MTKAPSGNRSAGGLRPRTDLKVRPRAAVCRTGGLCMSTGSGLLAVWMRVAPFLEDDLNAWYEKEHIAERLGIPGFLSARRYVSEQAERRYIAPYELSSPAVMQSEPYLAARTNPTPWTDRIGEALIENVRNEYELVQSVGEEPDTPAPFALVVRIESEAADDGELNAWYEGPPRGAAVSPGLLSGPPLSRDDWRAQVPGGVRPRLRRGALGRGMEKGGGQRLDDKNAAKVQKPDG
jgi:hypothetical protein